MPRLPRALFDGIPHHINQRGNRREDVFFTHEDRVVYLRWLHEYCSKYEVKILAYCLMTNHVHLVLQPEKGESISQALKPLHMRYAQRINRLKGWSGNMWQGRFFSSPLDDAYFMAAVAYIERNPVRADMVAQAEDYKWSSASAHCGLSSSSLLAPLPGFFPLSEDWSKWLGLEDESQMKILRQNVTKGLPCGKDSFIRKLEKSAGRSFQFRHQGRPKKGTLP